ncbi:MAG: preprotein translocase subunit SecG [Rhodothermales bacterium]|nr:preprotein translocase subunit SecG [Rhodothermales bacterium]
MYIFIIVVITIIALLIGVVVLVQSGKGGGLAGIAAGGQTTQILGARQAPDTLEKLTWGLGISFILLCILANFFAGEPQQRSVIGEELNEAPIESPLPAGPGTVQEQPTAPPAPAPEPAPAEQE